MSRNFLGRLTLSAILSIFLVIALTGCGSEKESELSQQQPTATTVATVATENKPEVEKLTLKATTPILTNWVRNIGGARVEVESLVPYGINPHGYQPGAKTLGELTNADGVFLVGLGYEGLWLTKLIHNNKDLSFIDLGEAIEVIHDEHDEDDDHDEHDEDDKHDDHKGHDHSQGNPHYWFDPIAAVKAVEVIAAKLSEIDPDSADFYAKNLSDYIKILNQLDKDITEQISSIPKDNRKLMTEHDSMIYFTSRYGLESIESVIPRKSTETGPTPKDLKRAIEAVKKHNLKVLFVEAETNKAAAERVAEETGLALSEELQVETLNEGQSYDDFMRNNLRIIVSSLTK